MHLLLIAAVRQCAEVVERGVRAPEFPLVGAGQLPMQLESAVIEYWRLGVEGLQFFLRAARPGTRIVRVAQRSSEFAQEFTVLRGSLCYLGNRHEQARRGALRLGERARIKTGELLQQRDSLVPCGVRSAAFQYLGAFPAAAELLVKSAEVVQDFGVRGSHPPRVFESGNRATVEPQPLFEDAARAPGATCAAAPGLRSGGSGIAGREGLPRVCPQGDG